MFQPFATYHFSKNAYIFSNAQWTIDWVHHSQIIPLDIGFGYTYALTEQFKIDSSLQFEWTAYQNAVVNNGYVNQYTLQFCFNILFD